ncbi:MAG TPA: hypothetical protein VFC29_00315, partial [Candidatus Limnocylindrales bacterium]|nr:hypothetical protein [Candidatus Limnocylindrales bacterium]
MPNGLVLRSIVITSLIALVICAGCRAVARTPIPPAATDSPLAQTPGKQTAVFAGGCFWGTQSV